MRVGPALAALLAVLALGGSDASAAPRHPPPWLVVSDVHLTPFAGASKRLVGRLEAAPVRRWRALLARTGRAPSPYGQDTNAALLESALRAMRRAAPSPPVVLLAGDLLGHDFRQTYEQRAPAPTARGYRRFVDKTVAYLAARFDATFPRAQFVVTLGNNDSYCGDYRARPDSRFLARTARAWAPLVDRRGAAPGFARSFRRLGSYVADLPGSRLRAVAVDDVFWSAEYDDACGRQNGDPGAALARWLDAAMRQVPAGGRALMVTHVPPGIDVYATLQGTGAPVPLLTGAGRDALLAALDGPRVPALVFGHLHMSTYRVARGTPMLGVPAISPEFGNDPAFLTATVGRRGEIADFTAHALDLGDDRPRWRREYRFGDAYGQPAFDAPSLRRLTALLADDAGLRHDYERFYVSGGRYATDDAQYPAYACGSTVMEAAAFSACVDGAG